VAGEHDGNTGRPGLAGRDHRAAAEGIVRSMGTRSVTADVRDAFGSELDAGQQSALISWLAFTGTFSGVRAVTHAIRRAKGRSRT
jgi:hypothetical protein